MGACLSSCRKAAPPDGKDDDTTKLANGGQQQQAPPGNTADEIGGVDNKAFEDDRQGKGLLVEKRELSYWLMLEHMYLINREARETFEWI